MKFAIIHESSFWNQHIIGVQEGLIANKHNILSVPVSYRDKRDWVSKIHLFKPDAILFLTYLAVNDKLVDIFKGEYKTILWYDDAISNNGEVTAAPDVTLLSDPNRIDFYKDKFKTDKVMFLPCASRNFRSIPRRDPRYDNNLIFMGQMNDTPEHGWRTQFIRELQKHMSIEIVPRNGLASDYIDPINHYRNANYSLSINSIIAPGYTSNRFFLIPGCGGFMVCYPFKGAEEYFSDSIHCKYFTDSTELIRVVKYYNEFPEKREAIRQVAFQHAQKHHSYKVRIQQLISKIRQEV